MCSKIIPPFWLLRLPPLNYLPLARCCPGGLADEQTGCDTTPIDPGPQTPPTPNPTPVAAIPGASPMLSNGAGWAVGVRRLAPERKTNRRRRELIPMHRHPANNGPPAHDARSIGATPAAGSPVIRKDKYTWMMAESAVVLHGGTSIEMDRFIIHRTHPLLLLCVCRGLSSHRRPLACCWLPSSSGSGSRRERARGGALQVKAHYAVLHPKLRTRTSTARPFTRLPNPFAGSRHTARSILRWRRGMGRPNGLVQSAWGARMCGWPLHRMCGRGRSAWF